MRYSVSALALASKGNSGGDVKPSIQSGFATRTSNAKSLLNTVAIKLASGFAVNSVAKFCAQVNDCAKPAVCNGRSSGIRVTKKIWASTAKTRSEHLAYIREFF